METAAAPSGDGGDQAAAAPAAPGADSERCGTEEGCPMCTIFAPRNGCSKLAACHRTPRVKRRRVPSAVPHRPHLLPQLGHRDRRALPRGPVKGQVVRPSAPGGCLLRGSCSIASVATACAWQHTAIRLPLLTAAALPVPCAPTPPHPGSWGRLRSAPRCTAATSAACTAR